MEKTKVNSYIEVDPVIVRIIECACRSATYMEESTNMGPAIGNDSSQFQIINTNDTIINLDEPSIHNARIHKVMPNEVRTNDEFTKENGCVHEELVRINVIKPISIMITNKQEHIYYPPHKTIVYYFVCVLFLCIMLIDLIFV
jgi:hypothetical protein